MSLTKYLIKIHLPNNQFCYCRIENGKMILTVNEWDAERFQTKIEAQACLNQFMREQPMLTAEVIGVNPLN